MRYPPSPEQPLSERPRTDRAGRRSSVTVTDSMVPHQYPPSESISDEH